MRLMKLIKRFKKIEDKGVNVDNSGDENGSDVEEPDGGDNGSSEEGEISGEGTDVDEQEQESDDELMSEDGGEDTNDNVESAALKQWGSQETHQDHLVSLPGSDF